MKFLRTNEATNPDAIKRFETALGIELPRSYVDFLLSYNGGTPSPENRYVDLPYWNELLVTELHGLSDVAEHSIETSRFTNFSKPIADRMLVIGHDPFAEEIVMDLRPSAFGKIYVRAHAYPPSQSIGIDDTGFTSTDYEEAALFVRVADSFEQFLAILGREPD